MSKTTNKKPKNGGKSSQTLDCNNCNTQDCNNCSNNTASNIQNKKTKK